MARVPLEPAAMDRPRNCAPPCGKILARCVAAIEGRELQARPILYSEAYKHVVTLLLMAAYTFNSMDRSIISIIASPMKLDLKLTDTELGLLGGTAFAVLYALGGVPIARLAERINRVGIITAALIVWSGLTALCGAARTFPQLLLIRAGVGVAEAGCSPPAHSLISDYYEPSRRTSALSIYTCGISLGYILAAVVGGYVAQHFGWRIACTTVGLPGVATAVLIKIFVREPPRGYSDASPPATGGAPFSLRGEWRELRAVGKALLLDRPILHMVLGVTIGAFAAYGFYAFVPPYFSRAFGLGFAAIGIIAALSGGVAVGIGILAGGFIADSLARRSARWYALVPAVGAAIALPVYLLALLEADWKGATWALSVAGFFQYASLGPTLGVVQNAVGTRRRATAAALLYICLSVIALGLGPVFTGWAIDRFAEGSMVSFTHRCPGGAALAGAPPAAEAACRRALALATRHGLDLTLVFFGWASLHYFLAAAGIEKSLRAATLRNAAAVDPV
ncbi:MAG: spinster family MFS transporter [Steroidobacteraceae bacterium]